MGYAQKICVFLRGPTIWRVMPRNVYKTTQQLYKVSTPCIDDHHFKEEEFKSVGLSKVCSQIVLKCLYLACVGRPDNKLARSITKWTKACDKRSSRLISCIHHHVMWETLPNNAILRIQNLHQVEHCAFLEVIQFAPSIRNHFLGCRIERLDGKPALDS